MQGVAGSAAGLAAGASAGLGARVAKEAGEVGMAVMWEALAATMV